MRPLASRVSSCVSLAIAWLLPIGRRLEHPLEDADGELTPNNGCYAQAALGLLRQLVNAGQQKAVQRLWDFYVGDLWVGHPAVARPNDCLALDQHADDLFDEERVALRPLQDLV